MPMPGFDTPKAQATYTKQWLRGGNHRYATIKVTLVDKGERTVTIRGQGDVTATLFRRSLSYCSDLLVSAAAPGTPIELKVQVATLKTTFLEFKDEQ